jgi:molecular chaperone GrpE
MSKDKHNRPYDPDLEDVVEDNTDHLITEPSHGDLIQKLNETEQKLNEAERKAMEYWDRIVRMQADADNAVRRSKIDLENAHKYALDKFVGELIPIIDSLELCAGSVPPELQQAAQSVVEGVDLTLKMFYNAMEKFGVKQVNPVGEVFNPETQQAISMQEDPNVKQGSVISVLQKGYTLNNRLIRPALVVVAKAKE